MNKKEKERERSHEPPLNILWRPWSILLDGMGVWVCVLIHLYMSNEKKTKTMIDMLWSVQWIWTKSHLYKLKKWQPLRLLECLMLTFRSYTVFYFSFSFLLFLTITNLWSSIEASEELAYNRWILCLRWTIIILVYRITQRIEHHQLALEKKSDTLKKNRPPYDSLSFEMIT
jgi:hypothetical protein